MDQVKVSVIVPIFNMQALLATCLDSILNQTFRDFELILVDDGSTDQSPAICCHYRDADARIRVISKENGGLSSARNAGLDAASGKYIYFADSDDYLEPDLLEKAVQVMEQQDCHWVGFGAIKEDLQGNCLGTVGFKPYSLTISGEEERVDFLMQYLLSYRLGWEACFHLFRGDIIRQHQLRFVSEREVFAEDLLFSFTYWQYARSCVMLPECLYHYVQRPDSLMGASRTRDILPQVHKLALEAKNAALRAGHTHIVQNFASFYIHLLEWQTRPLVAQKGTSWLKEAMGGLNHSQLLDCAHWAQVYREYLCRFGRISGVVTAVIPLLTREDIPGAEACIGCLLEQSLQKLDIMVLCAEGLQVKAEDFRIRQIPVEDVHKDAITRTACREALGEYLYFADPHTQLPVDFLAKMGDALKYNDCSSVLPAAGPARFLDRHDPAQRAYFREYLHTYAPPRSAGLFRTDLLEKSGLSLLPELGEYMADILLSGHILLTD